jgi:3,4-dihydroxy 2-butanone 4-phosphate synthase/GTP cyclohydrolase II
VICEIMNADGSMARVDDLRAFAERHKIKMGTIEDLIKYRLENESFVEERVQTKLDSQFGEGFQARLFVNRLDGRQHIAIVKGELDPTQPTLVRVHVEDVMGDVFASHSTPSRMQLQAALTAINAVGRGVLLYLRLENVERRLLDPQGERRHQMDERDYGVGAQILRSLGLHKIVLITNHATKRVGLKAFGIEIVDTIAMATAEQGAQDADDAQV